MDSRIEALRAAVQANRVSGDFPISLLRQFDQRGSLSEKQWYWVERLARPQQQEQLPSFSGVLQLFGKAMVNLKHPKIRLAFGDNRDPLCLALAGPRSRYTGSIMLTDGSGYGGTYYGRVSPEGVAVLNDRTLTPNAKQELVRVLTALAERPAEVAAEYGRLTGNCCFCMRALSDERSTAVGYGPTCATNYGLPWGE